MEEMQWRGNFSHYLLLWWLLSIQRHAGKSINLITEQILDLRVSFLSPFLDASWKQMTQKSTVYFTLEILKELKERKRGSEVKIHLCWKEVQCSLLDWNYTLHAQSPLQPTQSYLCWTAT